MMTVFPLSDCLLGPGDARVTCLTIACIERCFNYFFYFFASEQLCPHHFSTLKALRPGQKFHFDPLRLGFCAQWVNYA